MTSTLIPSNRTMRAVVKLGPTVDNVRVETVAVPQTPAAFARVRVLAAGICGTDVHIAHDEYGYEAPVVMGHEITGVVDQVGDSADQQWLGARVACETYFSTCEACQMCRAGRRNLCAQRRSLGSIENGGFAEFVVLPVRNLRRLPDWLGEYDGALAEPLACVANCLMSPPIIQAGDRVLVTGPGTMGQLAAQVALAHGARVTLLGLENDRARLNVAAAMGMITTTDPVESARYDVVLECSGNAAAAAQALDAARRGGRYVQIGIFGKPAVLDFDQVLYKELTVTSGFASTATSWNDAMRLLQERRIQLGSLITQRFGLDSFGKALAAAESGQGLKSIVMPH